MIKLNWTSKVQGAFRTLIQTDYVNSDSRGAADLFKTTFSFSLSAFMWVTIHLSSPAVHLHWSNVI